MHVLTICFTSVRDKTGVIEIGLKSFGCIGLVIFGTGVMMATFHCRGTMPAVMDKLNSSAIGTANRGAPRRKKQAATASSPVAINRRRSSMRKTVISVMKGLAAYAVIFSLGAM